MSAYHIDPPDTEQVLLQRARAIAGLRLGELAARLQTPVPENLRQAKGWAGQLLERYLGATAASLPVPDFQQLGVELKSLPLDSRGLPRESTYVCTVPMQAGAELHWEASWVRLKLQRVLWVPLQADRAIPLAERRIGNSLLWSPSTEQQTALRRDWEDLMEMVCLGQWDQLSAHHGQYLQIRPKAAHSRILLPGLDSDGQSCLIQPRGFYLRPRFTREILARHYAG